MMKITELYIFKWESSRWVLNTFLLPIKLFKEEKDKEKKEYGPLMWPLLFPFIYQFN